VVFLFYHFVLRKLTFYNWNRWYLIGYTLLSFVIPFIDISSVLEKNEWSNVTAITWVPIIGEYNAAETSKTASAIIFTPWNITMLLLFTGMLIMLGRFMFQLISFRRMMRKAQSIPGDGMKLYQVDEEIIPFSFGNSIFINQHLHTPEELQEIIRHEFVHVKQKHSIDIIWSEILCMINWYNPFAWLLKRSIRQNLEFIADNKVLGTGIDKKQYQYLLLKVIGNNQFSIAQKFNFSSLKKRIAMMNKLKTARLNLVRFLFILPAMAVILLSFRKQIGNSFIKNEKTVTTDTIPGVENTEWNALPTESEKDFLRRHPSVKKISWGYVVGVEGKDLTLPGQPGDAIMNIHFKNGKWDMYNLGMKSDIEKFRKNYNEEPPVAPAPPQNLLNDREYFVTIRGEKDNCTVLVKDKTGKEVKKLLLTDWNEKKEYYENLYGDILPPLQIDIPVPPQPPFTGDEEVPGKKAFLERNADVKNIGWVFNNVKENFVKYIHIIKKDGTDETYNLDDAAEKAKAEKKYGELPIPVPPLPPPTPPSPPNNELNLVPVQEVSIATISDNFEINDGKATIHLKNGATEVYNLNNKEEKKKFEDKFGKVVTLTEVKGTVAVTGLSSTNLMAPTIINTTTETPVTTHITGTLTSIEPITVTGKAGTVSNLTTVVQPVTTLDIKPIKTTLSLSPVEEVTVIANNKIIGGKEELQIRISKYSTREQLEEFKKQAKEKGVDLQFDEIKYNTKNVLTAISGKIKSKDNQNVFSCDTFETLVLTVYSKNSKTYFTIIVQDKEVI
jgi:beta-lactamase regulating signal transducer with metallopeptidase domain